LVLILVLTLLNALELQNASSTTTSVPASQQLPIGGSWILKRYASENLTGRGGRYGTIRETWKEMDNFTVLARNASVITIERALLGSYSCVASSRNWMCSSASGLVYASNGSYGLVEIWNIELTNLQVKNFTAEYVGPRWLPFATSLILQLRPPLEYGATGTFREGVAAWLLIDPTGLSEGGTVHQLLPVYWGLTAPVKDLVFGVGAQAVTIKGTSMKAWTLTWTGDSLGYYSASLTQSGFSKGQETDTYVYDPVFGVLIGDAISKTSQYPGSDGFTETYVENGVLLDTNLFVHFNLNAEPNTGVAVTVDDVEYTADQLPKVFNWPNGSTHVLQVSETINGPRGVRYVFSEWSDGVKDAKRNVTATRTMDLKAVFKTQYYLDVVSSLGNPQGTGWYDSGIKADFAVTSPLGFLILNVFDHWEGDATGRSASASVVMDRPKTVTAVWHTDYTQLIILVGALIGLAVAVVVVGLLLLRRKRLSTSS
jgi:hypothetical protein